MTMIWEMVKVQFKMLLRKKGFLFFLFFIPIAGVFLLNQNITSSAHSEGYEAVVEDIDAYKQIAYARDYSRMPVIVFDGAQTELSEEFLSSLVNTGVFQIYRIDSTDMSEEDIDDAKDFHIDKNHSTCFIEINSDFTGKALAEDSTKGITVYTSGSDERNQLLERSVSSRVSAISDCARKAAGDEKATLELINKITSQLPVKNVVSAGGNGDEDTLSTQQKAYSDKIGYTLVCFTLGFVYLGVFISTVTIEEKKNKVYSRIMMTGMNKVQYILSKFFVSVLTVCAQTVIIGILMQIFVNESYGISQWAYLILIFMMGLVFCNMSMCIGMAINNAMNASYIGFTVWCISSTMAGLCFPLDDTGALLKSAALLMPQKWVINVSQMLMLNNNMAYPTMILVTTAYLLIIASITFVSMKVSHEE